MCLVAAGCGQAVEDSPAGPEAALSGETSLPDQATVALDDIQPPIAAPRNPPDAEALPERVSGLVSEGEKRLAQQDYPWAVDALERALGFAPNNARVLRALGLAYAGLQNVGKATEHLGRALELAPDDLQAQFALGQLYIAQKDYDRALLALRTAAKCSDFESESAVAADALLTLAGVLAQKGYHTAALECYTKLSKWIDTHSRDYLSSRRLRAVVLAPQRLLAERGRLLLLMRDSEAAAEMLNQAFVRDRTNRTTAQLLVEALVAAEKFEEGEELLVDLATEPSQREHLPALADKVCLAAGDKDMPSRIWVSYRKKRRDRMDISLAAALARTASKLGGQAQAAAILEPVVEEMPGDAGAAVLLARLYARQGKSEKAIRLLAGLLADAPDSAPAVRDAVTVIAGNVKEGAESRFAGLADADRSPAGHAMHYVAGLLARCRSNNSLAAEQFRKAIEAGKTFLPAYEALSELMIAQERFDEALGVCRQLRELDADHYLAYYIQGRVKLAKRDVRSAMDALEEAKDRNPEFAPTWLALAWANERIGARDEAETLLVEAARQWPDDVEVCRSIFDREASRGRYEMAGLIARKLVTRRPDSVTGRIMRAELALLAGNVRLADDTLKALREEHPEAPAVHVLEARILTHPARGWPYRQEHDRAVARLREIVGMQPADVSAGTLLAGVLARMTEDPEAVAVLENLRRNVPENLYVDRLLISTSLSVGMPHVALSTSEALLRDDPSDLFSRNALVDSLVALKRPDEAVAKSRTWLREARDNRELLWHRLKLLEVLEKSERYQEAQAVIDELLLADPSGRTALSGNKIRLYVAAKDCQSAVEFVRRASKAPDYDPDLGKMLVAILLEAEEYDKLESAARELIGDSKDKSAEPFRAILIIAMARGGRKKEAMDYARSWIAEERYNLEPRQAIFEALCLEEDYGQAQSLLSSWIKELSTGAETQPEGHAEVLKWCRTAFVGVLGTQEKYAEALKSAEEYLRENPGDAEMLQLRWNCLSEIGKPEKALADLEAAYRLKSDDAMMNNNLGYTYADMGIKLEEAEKMIRKALSARPGEMSIQDSQGWLYYKQGKVRLAGGVFAEVLRRAGDKELEHAVIYDHAGDAFYRLGWTERASKMWSAAIDAAKAEKRRGRDLREILKNTPRKLRELKLKWRVKVAPLGEGVKQEGPE